MENIKNYFDVQGMDEIQVGLLLNRPNAKMERHSKYIPNQDIIQQIDMTEIKFLKAIGKGSFGVVHKALWSGKTVAVKKVETDTEVTAFQNEIKQLSRVKHENIIQMYGIGSSKHAKCMVMEFASDGSLYQLLHCPPFLKYNLSHALSWLLQCAKAIAYLHSIEPRPIIHRDLKPLNMLLTNEKKVLKICDFGTACDLRSVMTDNKGSTVWMAPEVIKGCNYNEKCDVYSWGIILWELLTRRMPFKELGQPYRILWQVVNEVRPPFIQGCPKPIEKLMRRCWLDEQSERPGMQEVVDIVSPLYNLVCGIEDLANHSSGNSYTGSSVFSNEEPSENHTSHDVSELTTGTNVTLDSPYQCTDRINGSSSSCMTSDRNEQDGKCSGKMNDNFMSLPPHTIGPLISPVSPSILLPPPLGNDRTDDIPPPIVPANSGRISFMLPPPPEMQTPLSISIPSDGPAERLDVSLGSPGSNILVNPGSNTLGEPACIQHNPDMPSVPTFPWIIPPPTIIPDSTSVVANSVADVLPSSVSFQLHRPTADSFSSSNIQPISTLSTTCIPSPTTSSNQMNKPSLRLRPHPQSQAFSSNWRRSAELSCKTNMPESDLKAHRRSSSYELSKLIGFEPFAAETLLDTYSTGKAESTSLESNKHKLKQDNKLSEFADVIDRYSNVAYNQDKNSPSSISEAFSCDSRLEAPPVEAFSSPNRGFSSAFPVVSPSKSHTFKSTAPEQKLLPKSNSPVVDTENDELGAFWQLLDDDLKPAMPMPSCTQSQQIFNDHKGLAHQLFVIQEEIVYLDQEKKRLLSKLDDHVKEETSCRQRYSDKISQLKNKNESLRLDFCRLSKQLEEIRNRRNKDESSTIPEATHHAQGQPTSSASQDSLRQQLSQHWYCESQSQSHENL